MPGVTETQLALYNDALKLCEEETLGSVTGAGTGLNEDRKPRYLLDDVWNNGGVSACLEESDWIFARRTLAIAYDPSIQPNFGYLHGFQHPADWLRTSAISPDPYQTNPLTQYKDERGYWWCDLETIYVTYVSNDANYGGNFALWTESFKAFAAAHFAQKIIGGLTHDKRIKEDVYKERQMQLYSARGKDAQNEPPGFFPRGQLVRARRGSYFGRPNYSGGDRY